MIVVTRSEREETQEDKIKEAIQYQLTHDLLKKGSYILTHH
jgi:hypothetical protein